MSPSCPHTHREGGGVKQGKLRFYLIRRVTIISRQRVSPRMESKACGKCASLSVEDELDGWCFATGQECVLYRGIFCDGRLGQSIISWAHPFSSCDLIAL